ncbi:Tetratricopeptide repeat protein SKI3-like protein [Drosera capensis]
MTSTEEDDEGKLRALEDAVEKEPDEPSHHVNLALFLWERGKGWREKAAEHFVLAAKLNPQNGEAFRYLGDYYSALDKHRALKCYQRAVSLNPDDSYSGETLCDLRDEDGKETLEIVVCEEASTESSRDFWALRRLGYLLALGLAYQQLAMYTWVIKSYGRALELDDSRAFSMIESGNILLMLGSFREGVEQFQKALDLYPHNVSAKYGLASGLFALSKECMNTGAFAWAASLLEEASDIAIAITLSAGNMSCIWKLYGNIQLTYARCYPWNKGGGMIEKDGEAFTRSLFSWKRTCSLASVRAINSFQRALHLAPWLATAYTDIAVATDLASSLKETNESDSNSWQLPEKMSRLELYSELEEKQLAGDAFDEARSIEPSLALPWAGMSAVLLGREPITDEAYESCLRAVQIMPLAEYQIGLAKLAMVFGQLSSSQVFGAIQQAVHRAPFYPEVHYLSGVVCEAQSKHQSSAASYRIALHMMRNSTCSTHRSHLVDVSFDLARVLCKAGNALDAVEVLEDLKGAGPLDVKSLQIYAISLWQLGKSELALCAVRDLAKISVTMQQPSAALISLICRLLYSISGLQSSVNSISKMAKELFQSAEVSFIVSAVHALDESGRLELVVSSSRSFLSSREEVIEMHGLVALSKLLKNGSGGSLGMQSAIAHLRKALHLFPNAKLLRNLLGYLLLAVEGWDRVHVASRCSIAAHSNNKEGLRSGLEISGAVAVACHVPPRDSYVQHSLLACEYQGKPGANGCAKNHGITVPKGASSSQYQKFQLLLTASEVGLHSGDLLTSISCAKDASELPLPNHYLFFAHLQLCHAHAAKDDYMNIKHEYMKCLELRTDYPIGWICLKFIESQYNPIRVELGFRDCLNGGKNSLNMCLAVYHLQLGLISSSASNLLRAEEFVADACSLAGSESSFLLCHGAICMELARSQHPEYLSDAMRSLKKAKNPSLSQFPF